MLTDKQACPPHGKSCAQVTLATMRYSLVSMERLDCISEQIFQNTGKIGETWLALS